MRITCLAALVATSRAFTPPPRVKLPRMRRTPLRATTDDLTPGQRTALLGSLIGVYTSNQWCRQLLFSTVDFTSDDPFRFLNVGLELSRADYALLSTITFNALFAACSLAAGALVDRTDAVKLTYLSCGVWSLATVATAYTDSFAGVAACRALQGVAMAATAPAGYALLGRAFPADKLATATSRYAAAVSAGGALAAISTRLDDVVGWRGAFTTAGAASLVVALAACLCMPTDIGAPPPAQAKDDEAGGFGGVFASPAAVALLAATAVRFAAGFTIGVWALPCLRANFPDADVGVGYAVVVGGFGFVSALAGGAAADGLAARVPAARADASRALVPAAGCLLAAPLWVLALNAPSYAAAIAFLAAEFLVAECWFGPTTALLQQTVPPSSRGAAQGCFTALTLVGGLAPLAVGAAVDRPGGLELVPAVAGAVAAAYVVSAVLFVVAAGLLDGDAGKAS
jgi:predicted MFS family arabinose efflux permease